MSEIIQNILAERIGGNKFGKDTAIYKFEKIKRAKRAALAENPNAWLIDMGVGEPDQRADNKLIDILKEEALKKENRFYSDNGIADFKNAVIRYMKNRFNVSLTETQVNHSIGSKPAFAMIPLTLINPGDTTILTVPGYPIIGTSTKYLGGNTYPVPLLHENKFLPQLDKIPADVAKKAKIFYVNYPNNPTGAVAPVSFYKELIAFAKEHNIAIVQDAAYIELVYDSKQESILNVEGGMDVAIEVHSLSKSFNMTGWRLGFVCGNEVLVKAFAAVKDNNDSGQFSPIQKAGAYALDHVEELVKPTRTKYERRLKALTKLLRDIGFTVGDPAGTFYLYFQIPKGTKSGKKFNNAEEFCEYLIKEKFISSVPWDDAGNFLRFTVTFEADTIEEENKVINEIKTRLTSEEFIF